MSDSTTELCACGRCGKHPKPGNRYVHGHNNRQYGYTYTIADHGYETPCWDWDGGSNPRGYGRIGGHSIRAGGAFYERENGPVPDGLELDHLCRNHACVRPSHLEAVTHAVNVQRGKVAKLTPSDVLAIRDGTNAGRSLSSIGREYSVSKNTVWKILRGDTWKNVS